MGKYLNYMLFLINKIRNRNRLKQSISTIQKLQGAYKGERCFIIGNGPSLNVEDLNKLQNEYCFGTNSIYKMFDKTLWRPTFYCAEDQKVIISIVKDINKLKVKYKFIALAAEWNWKYPAIKGACYLNLLIREFYPQMPLFSEDISKGIYEGLTVTYICMQLAMYMGFDEIFLLGVDHTYSIEKKPDGTIVKNNCIKDHFSDDDKIVNMPQIYKTTLAFEAAKHYAQKNNVSIYNATRGGALEVFKRVNFDEVISK